MTVAGLVAGVLMQSPAVAHTPSGLGSMLLRVGDMPTGWGVDHTSSSSASVGCLQRLSAVGIKKTASATAKFALHAGLPSFMEELATYGVPLSKVFDKGVAALDRCTTITGTSGGHKLTGTIGAMSLPRYGNQSAAWTITVTVGGLTAREDVIVVRKGAILAFFAEGNFGPVDITQFRMLVSKALAKLG